MRGKAIGSDGQRGFQDNVVFLSSCVCVAAEWERKEGKTDAGRAGPSYHSCARRGLPP